MFITIITHFFPLSHKLTSNSSFLLKLFSCRLQVTKSLAFSQYTVSLVFTIVTYLLILQTYFLLDFWNALLSWPSDLLGCFSHSPSSLVPLYPSYTLPFLSTCPLTAMIPRSTLCPLSFGHNIYSKSAPKCVPIIFRPTYVKLHWTLLHTKLCSLNFPVSFSQGYHYSPFSPAWNLIALLASFLFFHIQAGTSFFPSLLPTSYA